MLLPAAKKMMQTKKVKTERETSKLLTNFTLTLSRCLATIPHPLKMLTNFTFTLSRSPHHHHMFPYPSPPLCASFAVSDSSKSHYPEADHPSTIRSKEKNVLEREREKERRGKCTREKRKLTFR